MTGPATAAGGRMPRRASLKQNVVAMYALQTANYLIPLATLPYLIRVLGAEQYGAIAVAYAATFFMVLFVDAGFNTLAIRRLARPGIGLARIAEIYSATQIIKVAQCAAMFLVLCALVLFVPEIGTAWQVYLATFPIVIGSLLFPTWLFQGLEIMHVTTLCSVGGRLLATIGIFACVDGPADVVTAALLQASAAAVSGLLSLPLVLRLLRGSTPVPRRRLLPELRRTLADARAFAPAEFATQAIDNAGVFILGLFAGHATVGIYAAIEKVARAAAGLFQPLTKALFPALAGRWISRMPDAAARSRDWTWRIALLAAVVSIAMYALAPSGLELLFGADWAAHAQLLRVLAAWLAASIAATVLGQFWLLVRGFRATYTTCMLKAAALQLPAAIVGAGLYGSLGLAFATVFAELARLALISAATRSGGRAASERCAS
ncbi:MAG: oligosaccharide flippase family protein [Gammaproteobacteria bacterium]|nr:oligosaccharide flippase family protein [Gammaproteobacteria bacterium]